MARWAEIYERELNNLMADIELAILSNSRIFLAMDFCDLYEHCIPSLDAFEGQPYDSFKYQKDSFSMRELTRCWLFNFNSIYNKSNKKMILLPPYFAETYDFFTNYNVKIREISDLFYDQEKKKYIQNLLDQFSDIDLENLDEIGRYQLLNRLGKRVSDLAFLFSPAFQQGSHALKDLLKNKMTPCPNEVANFMEIIFQAYGKDVYKIFSVFEDDRPNRLMQNYRDARALQYLEEINQNLNENEIVILISSAPSVNKIAKNVILNKYKDIPLTCKKIINKKVYFTVRDLEPFRVALIELSNLMGSTYLNSSPNSSINYTSLLSRLNDDLQIVGKFLSLIRGDIITEHSGRIKEAIENEIRIRFLEFAQMIRIKEETSLILFTGKNYPDIENLEYFKEFSDNDIISGLKQLKTALGSREFIRILEQRRSEIEGNRREILSWFKNYYDNLDLIELSRQMPIGSLDSRSSKLLEESSVEELVNQLREKRLEFPENAQMVRLNEKFWVLYDLFMMDNLYIIEKNKKNYDYYKLNLNIMDSALYQLRKKLAAHEIAESDIESKYVIDVIKSLIIPLSKLKNYRSIQKLVNHYDMIMKNLDIIDAYKSFGLDFSKLVWSN